MKNDLDILYNFCDVDLENNHYFIQRKKDYFILLQEKNSLSIQNDLKKYFPTFLRTMELSYPGFLAELIHSIKIPFFDYKRLIKIEKYFKFCLNFLDDYRINDYSFIVHLLIEDYAICIYGKLKFNHEIAARSFIEFNENEISNGKLFYFSEFWGLIFIRDTFHVFIPSEEENVFYRFKEKTIVDLKKIIFDLGFYNV